MRPAQPDTTAAELRNDAAYAATLDPRLPARMTRLGCSQE